MSNTAYIFCSKCGAPMKEDARYCMKCGTLNYDHPDNQSMKKYANKSSNNENKFFNAEFVPGDEGNRENDVIVGGKVIKEDALIEKEGVKSHNYIARFVYTILFSVFLFCIFMMFYNTTLEAALTYSMYIFIFIFSGVTMSNIYQKANYSPFTPFIPFYGQYILCEMLFDKGILFLLLLIPFVNILFSLVILYKLGEKFSINGIISVIFFPIVLLIISYSSKYNYKGNIGKNNKIVSVLGALFALVYLIVIFFSLNKLPILL